MYIENIYTIIFIFICILITMGTKNSLEMNEALSYLPPYATWVGGGWNGGAEGRAEGVRWNGCGRLLDAGGHWVDVVAGGHRTGGGQRLQGRYLPLGRRRLAVHSGGSGTVSTLYSDWYGKRGDGEWWRGRALEWGEQKRSEMSIREFLAGQEGSSFHKQIGSRHSPYTAYYPSKVHVTKVSLYSHTGAQIGATNHNRRVRRCQPSTNLHRPGKKSQATRVLPSGHIMWWLIAYIHISVLKF